ncbi:MAG TPA: L,D-transpeptidase [Actinomycetota bacterium]|nr:L,D-transpeptidase [Actinomycetota bacterium]
MPASFVRRLSSILGAVALTLLLVGGLRLALGAPEPRFAGPGASPSPTTTASPTPSDEGFDWLVGTAAADTVVAYAERDTESEVVGEFPRVNEQGAEQTFLLLVEERGPDGSIPEGLGWVEALLPVRPNGTTGYLRTDDLSIQGTDYRIFVDREEFSLTVFDGDEVVMETEVGIGTGETPTPVGLFYLTSLLQPPTNNTVYGSYAYGLSGFSETLIDWEDGGIIGLHGTNDPTSVGRQVSHGCIRMRNEDIEQLVPMLPLGTPIEIV